MSLQTVIKVKWKQIELMKSYKLFIQSKLERISVCSITQRGANISRCLLINFQLDGKTRVKARWTLQMKLNNTTSSRKMCHQLTNSRMNQSFDQIINWLQWIIWNIDQDFLLVKTIHVLRRHCRKHYIVYLGCKRFTIMIKNFNKNIKIFITINLGKVIWIAIILWDPSSPTE